MAEAKVKAQKKKTQDKLVEAFAVASSKIATPPCGCSQGSRRGCNVVNPIVINDS